MTWTDGRPFVATHEHVNVMRWNCRAPGEDFRCAFCGHKFKVGETVRWQFTNDVAGAGGNPFVCVGCDLGRDEIIAAILHRRKELKEGRWWWFVRGMR